MSINIYHFFFLAATLIYHHSSFGYTVQCSHLFFKITSLSEREREREVQVTSGVTLKSYTFFKSLDLSRSNAQKKIIINTNILIDLIYYLLFNTFYTYF